MAAFDLPDAVGITGQREVTTLPTQTLFLLNSNFVVSQTSTYANQLIAGPGLQKGEPVTDQLRVRQVFQSCFQRMPSEVELQQAMDYLVMIDGQLQMTVTDADRRRQAVWQSFCQAMLMTNEFRYVD